LAVRQGLEDARPQLLQEEGPFPLDAYRDLDNRSEAVGCLLWFAEAQNRDSLVREGLTDENIRELWRDLYRSCLRLRIPLEGSHATRARELGVI